MERYLSHGGLLMYAVILLILTPHATADSDIKTLKTAYILNIVKFVRWPPNALNKNNFTICIYKNHKLGEAIDKLESKRVKNKKINILYPDSIEEITPCQVVYISEINGNLSDLEYSKIFGQKYLLTIGDRKAFLSEGGIVSLFQENERLQFSISTKASENASLEISSQLLEMARKVK